MHQQAERIEAFMFLFSPTHEDLSLVVEELKKRFTGEIVVDKQIYSVDKKNLTEQMEKEMASGYFVRCEFGIVKEGSGY